MSLKEKFSQEIIKSTKSGERLRLETIRSLRALLLEKEIAKRPNPLTAEDEIGIVISAAKKRKESIEMYEKGSRVDLAEKEKAELLVIEEFLPKQLSASEIELIVRKIMNESGISSMSDFGKLMPLIMKELKGKGDGKLITEIVKKLLAG